MKGEIVDIATMEDEYRTKDYRVTIIFREKPNFRLGNCEINQE